MTEEWRSLAGFERFYEVSSLGRIRSLFETEGKILSQKEDARGYVKVTLYKPQVPRRTIKVHRIIAKTFIPNPDNKPQINHINGIRSDNRAENLEWCTQRENQRHACLLGLRKTKLKYNTPIKVLFKGEINYYNSYFEAVDANQAIPSCNWGLLLNTKDRIATSKGYQARYVDDQTPWKKTSGNRRSQNVRKKN